MARQEGKLIDPVAQGQKESEAQAQTEEIKTLSIEALSLDDFQPIPVTASRQPHPFDGYPQRKIKIGTFKRAGKEFDLIVSATHIVALNPKEYVSQDPSNKGVSMVIKGQEQIVDFVTPHNRMVRDELGRNIMVVFDRDILLADGKKLSRGTICPDHTARSQLVFMINKRTGKIEVDRRYVLADIDQIGRLRRCFEMYYYQQTQSERLAQKFESEEESRAQ